MPKITRITFNSSDWELPSGPQDKIHSENLFEGQFGFGFEEWWRNKLFQVQEPTGVFQYGFLQALNRPNRAIETLDLVHFYSRRNGENRIVATVRNLVILENLPHDFQNEKSLIREHLETLIDPTSLLRFDDGPTCRDVGMSFLNFKANIEDINYLGWDNGIPVNINNYRFKMLNYT